jgi:hypothetical protein
MNTLRRSSLKAKFRLESLEDRITPVAFDPTVNMAALLGHTNVIIKRESPLPSNPSGHKDLRFHRVHKTQPSPIIPLLAQTTSVNTNPVSYRPNTTPVSYQPEVMVSSNPTPSGEGATSTKTTDGSPPSNPTITPQLASPLPANVAAPLVEIYEEFQASGGKTPFTPTVGSQIQVEGSSVGVEIHCNGSNLDALLADMDKLGFQLSSTSTTTDTIAGLIPIDALATAAQDPLTLSITPEYLSRPLGLL